MRPSVPLGAAGVTATRVVSGNDRWSDEDGASGCDVTQSCARTPTVRNRSLAHSVGNCGRESTAASGNVFHDAYAVDFAESVQSRHVCQVRYHDGT